MVQEKRHGFILIRDESLRPDQGWLMYCSLGSRLQRWLVETLVRECVGDLASNDQIPHTGGWLSLL